MFVIHHNHNGMIFPPLELLVNTEHKDVSEMIGSLFTLFLPWKWKNKKTTLQTLTLNIFDLYAMLYHIWSGRRHEEFIFIKRHF